MNFKKKIFYSTVFLHLVGFIKQIDSIYLLYLPSKAIRRKSQIISICARQTLIGNQLLDSKRCLDGKAPEDKGFLMNLTNTRMSYVS